jgi:site-specific DNA recombinase
MSSPDLMREQVQRWIGSRDITVSTEGPEPALVEKELSKLQQEESRYARAYGAGILTIEALQELVTPLKQRAATLKQQLDKAKDEARTGHKVSLPSSDEIGLFAERSVQRLNNLNFGQKREILCSVIEKIVGTPTQIKIYGHIQVTNHVELRSNDRHSQNVDRHQSLPIIPFELAIQLPPPRKERVIVARGRNGRIINSCCVGEPSPN